MIHGLIVSKLTLLMSTFFSRFSANFIDFISFFFLSANLLSWSALVPCRISGMIECVLGCPAKSEFAG